MPIFDKRPPRSWNVMSERVRETSGSNGYTGLGEFVSIGSPLGDMFVVTGAEHRRIKNLKKSLEIEEKTTLKLGSTAVMNELHQLEI